MWAQHQEGSGGGRRDEKHGNKKKGWLPIPLLARWRQEQLLKTESLCSQMLFTFYHVIKRWAEQTITGGQFSFWDISPQAEARRPRSSGFVAAYNNVICFSLLDRTGKQSNLNHFQPSNHPVWRMGRRKKNKYWERTEQLWWKKKNVKKKQHFFDHWSPFLNTGMNNSF